jgi:hypothetical protein
MSSRVWPESVPTQVPYSSSCAGHMYGLQMLKFLIFGNDYYTKVTEDALQIDLKLKQYHFAIIDNETAYIWCVSQFGTVV